MNSEYTRALIEYHYRMSAKLWTSIMTLTDAQFTEEVDYSIGSIRNHMVHLMSVDQRWLARVFEVEPPAHLKAEDYATRETAHARWDAIEGRVRADVLTLTDEALARVIRYNLPHRGGWKSNTVWQIIVHMVNHGTDHRAQVLPILYRFGAPTFEQDIMNHWWDEDSDA